MKWMHFLPGKMKKTFSHFFKLYYKSEKQHLYDQGKKPISVKSSKIQKKDS